MGVRSTARSINCEGRARATRGLSVIGRGLDLPICSSEFPAVKQLLGPTTENVDVDVAKESTIALVVGPAVPLTSGIDIRRKSNRTSAAASNSSTKPPLLSSVAQSCRSVYRNWSVGSDAWLVSNSSPTNARISSFVSCSCWGHGEQNLAKSLDRLGDFVMVLHHDKDVRVGTDGLDRLLRRFHGHFSARALLLL